MMAHKGWIWLGCSVVWLAGPWTALSSAERPKTEPVTSEQPKPEPATLQLAAALEPALSNFLGKHRDGLGQNASNQEMD